ncbi:single-strand selective monofunctional uracil DNA glycosylase-like [Otolemur garnettii]|uniref:single-strand selective monofunctional uracil DNA glycosylase-like n=1 Tax=Otolemur garnettii TaxID=30611 RepID=UPI000C7F0033|nr:single-strand selective monofunctional uracil DNA glycosylase-like [Otolemur garnettii]
MKKREENTTLVFTVDVKANKHQVKQAVENLCDIAVVKVNTLTRPDGEKPALKACAEGFLEEELRLNSELSQLQFSEPGGIMYNPVEYVWEPHHSCVTHYCQVLFLGMNPASFDLAQTGVPFGEVSMVRDWLDIGGPVLTPPQEHPKQPALGLECPQSEANKDWEAVAKERLNTLGMLSLLSK